MNLITKSIKGFFEKYPISILFLCVFSLLISAAHFIDAILGLMTISMESSSGNASLNIYIITLLDVIIGLVYLYITKWIWKRNKEGLTYLFYLTLLDLVMAMWVLSKELVTFVEYEIKSEYLLENLMQLLIGKSFVSLIICAFVIFVINHNKTKQLFK